MWLKPLSTLAAAVIFFNTQVWGSTATNVTVNWASALGFHAGARVTAYDLWSSTPTRGFDVTGSYTVSLNPTGFQMLRLVCNPAPCVRARDPRFTA